MKYLLLGLIAGLVAVLMAKVIYDLSSANYLYSYLIVIVFGIVFWAIGLLFDKISDQKQRGSSKE